MPPRNPNGSMRSSRLPIHGQYKDCPDKRDSRIAEELQRQAHVDQMAMALRELNMAKTIHGQYEDCPDKHDARIAAELQNQAQADQMTLVQEELRMIMTTLKQKLKTLKVLALAAGMGERRERNGQARQLAMVQQELGMLKTNILAILQSKEKTKHGNNNKI